MDKFNDTRTNLDFEMEFQAAQRREQVSTAKTAAQRKAEQRAREREAGLLEVRGIMAPAEKHQAIKDAAAKVMRKRVKATPVP